MLGIPGNFTPPSRFIRALFFANASLIKDNSQETAIQAFHILNNFDIPEGVVRSEQGDVTEYDITQWTAVHDLHKKKCPTSRPLETAESELLNLWTATLTVKISKK